MTASTTNVFAPAGCQMSGINLSAPGLAAADPPGAPANLSGSVNGTTVILTWSAPTSPDPAASYVIEAGASPGASNLAVFDTGSAAPTLSASDVPAGTYFVRVRAKNASGVSAPSNEIAISVGGGGGPCVPGPPTGLSASVTGTSVTFTWTAPAGACAPTGYDLVAGSSPGASDLANVALGLATSFAANAVPLGTYFVRVVARTASGSGPASNEVIVTFSLRGEVTDPIGDAVPVANVTSPDLMQGGAEVRAGTATFNIRLAPGTFDLQTTLLILYLDTDQNQSTGILAAGLGADYLVLMFGSNPAVVQQAVNQTWRTIGQVPQGAVSDGRDVAVPLSLLAGDDGRFNYRVSSFVAFAGGTSSGILDTMPNLNAAPGRVQ